MKAFATLLSALLAYGATAVAQNRVEDIYVARSIRESQSKPTEFCSQARTGFDNHSVEDRYSFQSVATRASDGLITDDNVNSIGRLRACFGTTPDPMTVKSIATIRLWKRREAAG